VRSERRLRAKLRINFCPQQFGGERLPLPANRFPEPVSTLSHFNRAFESSFCDPQGASIISISLSIGFTLRPEKSVGRANADLFAASSSA